MQGVIHQLAQFASNATYEDIPEEIVHETKRVILDSVGCALAGTCTDKGRLSVQLAMRLGGPPESSIIGFKDKVSCANSVFANGELINALDFDAILRPAAHVTPFVLPPALAVAEAKSSSGRQLILATVLGHEVSCRLAASLSLPMGIPKQDSDRVELIRPPISGYSVNAFGSAASAAKSLELDAGRMANALALAGYNAPMQAAGHWERSRTDAAIKYGSAGWIAKVGTTAAILAELGYTGDTSVLDGEYGYWRFSGSERWDPQVALAGLGKNWHIAHVRYKRYPCCGITHSALDCFTGIIEENGLAPADITCVKVWMDPLSEEPRWQNRRIDSEVHAQFSVPYDFAVAAHRVVPGPEWLDPGTRNDARIRSFMDKVTVNPHPDFGKTALETKGAQVSRIEVHAKGSTYVSQRRFASGRATSETEKPTDRELEEKFLRNAAGIGTKEKSRSIARYLWELEGSDDISEFMTLLRG
jgi:2-methylcitrate dehydratase PrpD